MSGEVGFNPFRNVGNHVGNLADASQSPAADNASPAGDGWQQTELSPSDVQATPAAQGSASVMTKLIDADGESQSLDSLGDSLGAFIDQATGTSSTGSTQNQTPSAWDRIPEVTIPPRLRSMAASAMADGILTGPELGALQDAAANDRSAGAFLTALRQNDLIKTRLPNGEWRAVTIYRNEKSGLQDIYETLPDLQAGATKTLKLNDLPVQWFNQQTIDALLAAARRGVKVEVTLTTPLSEAPSRRQLESLSARGLHVTVNLVGGGDSSYRTTLPRLFVDGHRLEPQPLVLPKLPAPPSRPAP